MKNYLLGLLILSSFLGCTEKVSEQLSKSATSSSNNNLTTEDPYSFELQNNMNENFSHLLHTAGDASSDCKLSFAAVPDAEDYDKSDKDLAADCILDVEESDLYFQGFDIKLAISEGLCEYVKVIPFAYWKFQPGRTNRFIYKVTCEDDACDSSCGQTYKSYTESVANTFQIGDLSNAVDDTAISKMCYFKHSNFPDRYGTEIAENAPNCDEGNVKTITLYISGNTTDVNCAAAYSIDSIDETDCAGEARNCLAGQGDDMGFDILKYSGIIKYNTDLSEIDEDYTFTSPYERGLSSNRILANFTRACAGADDGTTVTEFNGAGVVNTTGQGTANTVFQSDYFAGYLTELKQQTASVTVTSGANTISTTTATGAFNYGYEANGLDFENDGIVDAYAYATGPFRGIYGAQPYYGFTCLDKAYDVRAQIRLFVREWDREFSVNTDSLAINSISDYNTADTVAKIDNGGAHDLFDNLESWNDFGDWDDFFLNNYGSGYVNVGYHVVPTPDLETLLIDQSYRMYFYNIADADLTDFTITDFATDNRMDNACNEMTSPYDWRNFPME